MNRLKVCFIGIGSIAKRHINNLHTICAEKKIDLKIDAYRREECNFNSDIEKFIEDVYTKDDNMPFDYDIIFLTNPTEFHLEKLIQLHNHSKHFFIEKPLTSIAKMNEVFKTNYRKESVYYVACPLRYCAVIQYIKNNIDLKHVIGVRCICSSYLPEWRAGVDYRKTYSADKKLGGGVSIDLIHEWDYIKYLFGMPEKIFYTSGKKSNLQLNCEDYAIYVAEYKDKVVELHLDYFGRKAIREIMLFTDEDTIVGSISDNKITFLKEEKSIVFHEERDDYQKRELEHFLDIIQSKELCDNGIEEAYQTLQLTQGKVGI